MKFLMGLLLVSFGLTAQANEAVDEFAGEELKSAAELTLELDLENLNLEELDAMDLEAGQSIDGSEAMERMRPPRRGYRPPRRNPPRRPIPRPLPPRYEVMCVAADYQGYSYRGYDYRPYRAEQVALRRCRSMSYNPQSCYVQGCRKVRRLGLR